MVNTFGGVLQTLALSGLRSPSLNNGLDFKSDDELLDLLADMVIAIEGGM